MPGLAQSVPDTKVACVTRVRQGVRQKNQAPQGIESVVRQTIVNCLTDVTRVVRQCVTLVTQEKILIYISFSQEKHVAAKLRRVCQLNPCREARPEHRDTFTREELKTRKGLSESLSTPEKQVRLQTIQQHDNYQCGLW